MNTEPILTVFFFCSETGREPVRDWLREMEKDDRKAIGEDIKLVQFRWPLGIPLVRKIEADLWEVRSRLEKGRISRLFFTVYGDKIILLHGFIKKSPKTPNQELKLALSRKNQWLKQEQSHESIYR
jgi:phage-related protein